MGRPRQHWTFETWFQIGVVTVIWLHHPRHLNADMNLPVSNKFEGTIFVPCSAGISELGRYCSQQLQTDNGRTMKGHRTRLITKGARAFCRWLRQKKLNAPATPFSSFKFLALLKRICSFFVGWVLVQEVAQRLPIRHPLPRSFFHWR